MNTRRKKIRKDRLAILLVLCAVVITTIGFGIWKISGMLFHDPYETYKAYETKGKDYGDIQQVSKEYENEAFVSFTYPAYEEKELNSLVKAYEKKTVPAAGKTKKQITSIDYDSSLLFDRYVNLAFHRHTYNVDGVQTHTETTWMLYDKKQKKQLVLEDVLRREYPALVKRLAGEQG